MPFVSRLSITPVKGSAPPPDPRRGHPNGSSDEPLSFHLIDARGRLVNGKQHGQLVQITAEFDEQHERLSLRMPDREPVEGTTSEWVKPWSPTSTAATWPVTWLRGRGRPRYATSSARRCTSWPPTPPGTRSTCTRRRWCRRPPSSTYAAYLLVAKHWTTVDSGCSLRWTGARYTRRTHGPAAACRSAQPRCAPSALSHAAWSPTRTPRAECRLQHPQGHPAIPR